MFRINGVIFSLKTHISVSKFLWNFHPYLTRQHPRFNENTKNIKSLLSKSVKVLQNVVGSLPTKRYLNTHTEEYLPWECMKSTDYRCIHSCRLVVHEFCQNFQVVSFLVFRPETKGLFHNPWWAPKIIFPWLEILKGRTVWFVFEISWRFRNSEAEPSSNC